MREERAEEARAKAALLERDAEEAKGGGAGAASAASPAASEAAPAASEATPLNKQPAAAGEAEPGECAVQ